MTEYYNVGIGTVLVLISPLLFGLSCIVSRRISAVAGGFNRMGEADGTN